MGQELTEEFAMALGYDFICRETYFILEGVSAPSIKGQIFDGIARNISICYDVFPCGLDQLSPEAAISYAHRIIAAAHMAKCIEGMPVMKPGTEMPENND